MIIRCPNCGLPARRIATQYGVRNECCGMWSWGDKPLVDADTHEARKAAHEAFDPLWRSGAMTRAEAYAALRAETGLSEKNCHMARMSAARARRAADAAIAIRSRLGLAA